MPDPKTVSLSVIIVNWNAKPYLLRCLASLPSSFGFGRIEVIVVDNASRDGSTQAVTEKFPTVKLVANSVNRGFAGGINDGFRVASGEFVLVLNPDIMLGAGTLEPLIRFLQENPNAAAVIPTLVDDKGKVQQGYIRRLPTIMQVVLFATELGRWSRRHPGLVYRYLEFPVGSQSFPADVEQVPGAFLLTRKDILQRTQGLDESYLLFFEDVDWSVRVRAMGLRIVLLPSVSATHSGGRSLPLELAGWLAARYLISMIRYFSVHYGPISAAFVTTVLVLNASLILLRKFIARPFVSPKVQQTLDDTATRQTGFLRYLYRKIVYGEEVRLPE